MQVRRIGVLVLCTGATYLVVVAWLFSWWYVPAYRQAGPQVVSASAWYGGNWLFVLWAVSGPVGALLTAIGAGVVGGISGRRLSLSIVGAVLLAAWLALWSAASHQPVLFGVGGGLITVCFISSALFWARTRPSLSGRLGTAADLRIASHVLFFFAAWGLCGLLGAPIYAVRPQLMQQFQNTSGAPDMALKVLVSLVLGWVLIAASQYIECSVKRVA